MAHDWFVIVTASLLCLLNGVQIFLHLRARRRDLTTAPTRRIKEPRHG